MNPYRRRGALWWARWVGTAVCVLTVAAFLASLRCEVHLNAARWRVWLWRVGVLVFWRAYPTTQPCRGVRVAATQPSLRDFEWRPEVSISPRGHVLLPLWLPLLIIGHPTAFLWGRAWRRPLAGHCRNCGYNLTGNVSGRCPECGLTIPS